MKKLMLIAALAALGACSQKTDEPAPEATETVAAAAANVVSPGTYEVTSADGTKGTTVALADGTYTDTAADGTVTKGKWSVDGDKSCFTPDGGEATCYLTTLPAADGTFTATPDEGDPIAVKKVA